MRKINTARVIIYSLPILSLLGRVSIGSDLFSLTPSSDQGAVDIRNPTDRFANVEFTSYGVGFGKTGSRVRYRIPPHESLSLLSDEIFPEHAIHGGIQVSSIPGVVTQPMRDERAASFRRFRSLRESFVGSTITASRTGSASLRAARPLRSFRSPAIVEGTETALGNQPWRTVEGRAFYEKIDVTDEGLDLNHPVMVPIRKARVEVVDPVTNGLISVSQTDQFGKFEVLAPVQSSSRVRVLSRLRESGVLVLDNSHGNSLYAAEANLAPDANSLLIIARDATRTSGAFNILEMLQEGWELVRCADPALLSPDLTVFWSPFNSPLSGGPKEAIGSTYFDIRTNTLSLVGDRSVDSDEFDDSVIVHEYGHAVAAAFSQDSSPGGVHRLGDALDPRIAWSEGWANFFSSAVRNSPFFLDSYGPNGTQVLRYDLRDNIPDGDKPGYWSEFSVQSILWDFFANKMDESDSIEQPIQVLWPAFTALRQDHLVYLPYFLEHLVDRNPSLAVDISAVVKSRVIDFRSDARPSVANPFPRPIKINESVTGTVDSLSTHRKDLLQSSDFLMFDTPGGQTSIRMDIIGLGPGNNPNANDLDLLLYALDGRLVSISDQGTNAQSELIAATLGAGTYLLEVRSYYDQDETNKTVFNSGTYRLTVRTQ